jgi:hypothetical protein
LLSAAVAALGGYGSHAPLAQGPSSFLLSMWYREPSGIKAAGVVSHSFFLPVSSTASRVHQSPPPPPLVDCSPASKIIGPHRIVPNCCRHRVFPPSTVSTALSPLRPKLTTHSSPPRHPRVARPPRHHRRPPHCRHHRGARHAKSSRSPTRCAPVQVSSRPRRVAWHTPRTYLMPLPLILERLGHW